jgi:hypothetical protein
VLVLVVLAVLAVATLSAGMLQIGNAVNRRQASATNVKLAFYMAEAGLAEAYQGLSIGKSGNVGTENLPARFANGLFWVEATENADGTVTLDSTGMVQNGRAELSLVVEPRLASVASLGVFADSKLSIEPGMLIDGYDSGATEYEQSLLEISLGAGGLGIGVGGLGGGDGLGGLGLGGSGPGSTPPAPLGKLGANDDIEVSGTQALPTVIHGDLTPGPGKDVKTEGKVTINGSTLPAEAEIELPSPTLPSCAPSPGVEHAGAVPHVILSGSYQMPFLRAVSGAEIVIQGPATLVLDQLSLEGGAGLTFDTAAGSIEIYVTELLSFEAGTAIASTGQNAADVAIQVPEGSEPVLLAATGQFYGVIYAPESDVEVRAPFEVFGSLVGDELTFVGPVKLHFDRHLEELAQELALPRIVSWRILSLSNPPALTQVMDPFAYVGVAPAACPLPAKAHEDQMITVKYKLLGGLLTLTYNGLESAFDWSLVGEVESLVRGGLKVNPKGGGVSNLASTNCGPGS